MSRVAALVVAISVLAGACARPEALEDVIIDDPPARYTLVDGPPSGPLEIEQAAGATTLPANFVRTELDEAGFERGHMRTWERGEGDFLVVVVFELPDEESANLLARALSTELSSTQTVVPVDVEGFERASGFTVAASQREGDERALCHIVIFTVEQRFFEVRGCTASPSPFEPVRVLAARQHREATD